MAERLSGSWRVAVDRTSHLLEQSIVILDTGFADGRFSTWTQGDDRDVMASDWTIALETYDEAMEQWREIDVTRTTTFAPPHGLTIWLETPHEARIRCTSLDPALNPPQQPNPYDFTYPG